jgi:hypothetical protein
MRPRGYNRRRVRRQQPPKPRNFSSNGIDLVRCLICGKHLRVISGRHLSTHGTDRKTYIEEYRLSPDQLCSKTFRVNHSSRSDYCPDGKRDWIAAIKKIHKQHGHVFAGYLQDNVPHLYNQGFGFSVTGIKLFVQRASPRSRCGFGLFG